MPRIPSFAKSKKEKEGRNKLPQTPDEHIEGACRILDCIPIDYKLMLSNPP